MSAFLRAYNSVTSSQQENQELPLEIIFPDEYME